MVTIDEFFKFLEDLTSIKDEHFGENYEIWEVSLDYKTWLWEKEIKAATNALYSVTPKDMTLSFQVGVSGHGEIAQVRVNPTTKKIYFFGSDPTAKKKVLGVANRYDIQEVPKLEDLYREEKVEVISPIVTPPYNRGGEEGTT
jgi:hypothetical protein